MHVCRQGVCPVVSDSEARAKAKFTCPHINCGHVFFNKHGLKVHAGRCPKRDMYTAEKILAVTGETGSALRRFKVRWKGYGADDDTWEPRSHLPPHLIKEFLLANDLYDHHWQGARCELCDNPCKNARGVKCHMRHCYFNNAGSQNKAQDFHGRKAEAAAITQKRKDAQELKETVECEGEGLENVFLFKYLGSIFAADGSHGHDVTRRITLAMKRCGQLRNVFSSADVPVATKISIYKSAVMSLLTYGCEAWSLTTAIQARINGANARCLSRITGRSVHTEASSRTQTFNLVAAIKVRKWKWLGHILRTPGDRLTKLALRVQFEQGDRLNMLQDIPTWCETFEQLSQLAQNRDVWRAYQPTHHKANTRSSSATDTNITSPKPTAYSLRSRLPHTRCVTVSSGDPGFENVHNVSTADVEAPSPCRSEPKRPAKPMQLRAAKIKAKKTKVKPWSNKRRQEFALAYWKAHHDPNRNHHNNGGPTIPLTTSMTSLLATARFTNAAGTQTTPPATSPTSATKAPPTSPTKKPPTINKQLPIWARYGRWRNRHSAATQNPDSPAAATPTTTSPDNRSTPTSANSQHRTPAKRNLRPIWARYGRRRARCQTTPTPKIMPKTPVSASKPKQTPITNALRAVFDSDESSFEHSASDHQRTQADFMPTHHNSNLFKQCRHQPSPHANSELWAAAAPYDSGVLSTPTPSPSPSMLPLPNNPFSPYTPTPQPSLLLSSANSSTQTTLSPCSSHSSLSLPNTLLSPYTTTPPLNMYTHLIYIPHPPSLYPTPSHLSYRHLPHLTNPPPYI